MLPLMRSLVVTNFVLSFPTGRLGWDLVPRLLKISCSTQLSMNYFLLINIKMPTIVGILTLMSRKNSIVGFSEPDKKLHFLSFILRSI